MRQLLEPVANLEVVGEAEDGEEAIAAARRVNPDIVLLDARLPDVLTAEAVRRIRGVSPGSKIVVFTAHTTPNLLDDIRRLGVQGFVRKDSSPEQFVEVIEKVAAGETVTVASTTTPCGAPPRSCTARR